MEDDKFDAIVRYLSGEQASHGLAHLKRDSEQYVLPEKRDGTDGMCLISKGNGMKVYPRSVSKIIIWQIHCKDGTHLSRDPLHLVLRTQMFIDVSKRLIASVLLPLMFAIPRKRERRNLER